MLIIVTIFLSFFLQLGSPQEDTVEPTGVTFVMPAVPIDHFVYNLTIRDMTPRSITLRWSCKNQHLHDKYEVTLKPLKATYRIIETVPRNSCFQIIENLLPDTDYQIYLTLFSRNVRKRSNILTIKTPMEEPETEFDDVLEEPSRDLKIPEVKVVELSLVGLALILWIVAIALFFHRWGKIRMLLPYQPDFKDKTTGSSSACTNCVITPHHQLLQCSRLPTHHGLDGAIVGPMGLVTLSDVGCSPMRPRLNSFVASSTLLQTTDIIIPADLRIHRKAKSVEHLTSPNKFDEFDDIEFVDF